MREQIFVTEKRRPLLSFTLEAILGGTSSSSKERRRLLEEREASSSALQFCVSTTAFTALTAKRKPQGRWRWRPVAFHRKTFSLDLNFSFRRTFWKKPYLFSNAIFFFKDKISIAKQFSWEYVWAHTQFLNRGPGREEIEGTCYLPTLSRASTYLHDLWILFNSIQDIENWISSWLGNEKSLKVTLIQYESL